MRTPIFGEHAFVPVRPGFGSPLMDGDQFCRTAFDREISQLLLTSGTDVWIWDVDPVELTGAHSVAVHVTKHTDIADALEANYRLIVVDMRGHGASDKPHEGSAYTFTNTSAT